MVIRNENLTTHSQDGEKPINDISDHLEITHSSKANVAGEGFRGEEYNYPDIVDPTKKITKSKGKKSRGRGKVSQNQKEKEEDVEVEWDFDDSTSCQKNLKDKNSFSKQTIEKFISNEAKESSVRKVKDGYARKKDFDSDSDSDSRESGLRKQQHQLNSPGKRTIGSSSESDVALHEGAELSPDDNTDIVGSDGLRQSMQNILDQFMSEEKRFDK